MWRWGAAQSAQQVKGGWRENKFTHLYGVFQESSSAVWLEVFRDYTDYTCFRTADHLEAVYSLKQRAERCLCMKYDVRLHCHQFILLR